MSDDWDELSVCEVCGDRYVYQGDICYSCLRQRLIDNAPMVGYFDTPSDIVDLPQGYAWLDTLSLDVPDIDETNNGTLAP